MRRPKLLLRLGYARSLLPIPYEMPNIPPQRFQPEREPSRDAGSATSGIAIEAKGSGTIRSTDGKAVGIASPVPRPLMAPDLTTAASSSTFYRAV